MAQGDLFKGFLSSTGALQEALDKGVISAERFSSIQNELLEQSENMAKVRKNMWKADYKGQKVTERMASTMRKMSEHTKKIAQMKKEQLVTERQLAKIEAKIKDSRTSPQDIKVLTKEYDLIKLKYLKNAESLKMMKKATPVLGKLGSIGGGIADALGALGSVIPIIGGIISGLMKVGSVLLSWIVAPFKKGFELFLKTQSLVGNLAADIGMTAAQSKNLMNNIVGMTLAAMKFGGSMEDVISIYRQFSSMTGKNMAFNADEIAAIVELGKGTGLGVDGAAEMAASFENIGISLGKTVKLTDKARNIAARYNVNVTDVLKSYRGLVESLSGVGFAKGLDNLTKIAAKAQAIRFDIVGSTKAFTDAFFDPEKAVEASAKMQLLGGKFAQSFGDPMQLAFESMNDPTALAEKFAKTLEGVVAKDKMGNFFIPPADRKMLKMAAETLGQDYEMATKSALEQAKITDKMVALSKSGFSMMGISEEDKPALASLMKMNKNGKYEIQMSDGTTKLLENITDKNQLKAILDNRKKNDLAAEGRMNLMERLENIINRFTLGFTNVFNKIFANMDFENFLSKVEELGTSLAQVIFPAIEKLLNNKGAISGIFQSILDVATDIVSAITKIWSGDGSFMDKITGTIGTLVIKLFEVVKPYVQMALGKLLEIVGDAIPDFLGGTKMKNAGLGLQQSAIANDKTGVIPQLYKGSSLPGMAPDNGGSFLQGAGMYGKAFMGAKNIPKGLMSMALANKSTLGKGAMKLGAGQMLKRIPVLGALASVGFAINDAMEGDWAGVGLNLASGAANVGNIFAPGVGSAVSAGIDLANGAREMGAFNDGEITIAKNGQLYKGSYAKGDLVKIMDQAAAERAGTGSGSGSNSITHGGTIKLISDDGKVLTWDQMYAARDMIGSRVASISEGYKGGFGNYQNSNISPIQPMMV